MSDTPEARERNKGGRPRKPVDTSAPEFQEAVNAAVQAAIPQIAAQLVVASNASDLPTAEGEADVVQRLALAIAELTDQGTQRKRVAPEILARWYAARDRMNRLLTEAHERFTASGLAPETARAAGLIPEYRVVSKTYLNERIIDPFRNDPQTKAIVPQEIFWSGPPNECLRPLNDVARGIFEAFVESIGGLTAANKRSDNRPVWVTPGGLVVKGESRARREVAGLGDSNAPFADDLGLKGGAVDPRAEFVHVLGTVAEPARQNYQG